MKIHSFAALVWAVYSVRDGVDSRQGTAARR